MENETTPSVSTEAITQTVHMLRNSWLTKLLSDDQSLLKFLSRQFDVHALSDVKKEFLKRELNLLRSSPLDHKHYDPLIREVKERGGTELVGSNQLFLQEVEPIILKYCR